MASNIVYTQDVFDYFPGLPDNAAQDFSFDKRLDFEEILSGTKELVSVRYETRVMGYADYSINSSRERFSPSFSSWKHVRGAADDNTRVRGEPLFLVSYFKDCLIQFDLELVSIMCNTFTPCYIFKNKARADKLVERIEARAESINTNTRQHLSSILLFDNDFVIAFLLK